MYTCSASLISYIFTEILTKEYAANVIIGVLGFFRLLLPVLLQQDNCDFAKTIEIYDLCLHLLHDKSHSIINAALEVICIVLNEPRPKLKALLTTDEHVDIIRKRKSLKSMLFNRNLNESKTTSRKSSAETIKNVSYDKAKEKSPTTTTTLQSKELPLDDNPNVNKNKIEFGTMERKENSLRVKHKNCLDATVAGVAATTTDSDIEMDSFKSIEFDSEIAMSQSFTLSHNDDEGVDGGNVDNAVAVLGDKPPRRKKSDTTSLKSQKSTESIGSFINSLLSHSNTGKCSHFLPGSCPLHFYFIIIVSVISMCNCVCACFNSLYRPSKFRFLYVAHIVFVFKARSKGDKWYDALHFRSGYGSV